VRKETLGWKTCSSSISNEREDFEFIIFKTLTVKKTTKSFRFAASFWGINRLGSAFIIFDDSDMHIRVFK